MRVSPNSTRPLRWRLLGPFLVLAMGLALPSAGASKAWTAPAYQRTIGGPGHAGVYAWGAATAPDGSILIGDYWNYVLRRYSPSGQLLQTLSSRGKGPGQNSAPHGVAVDPNDGSVYLADMNHPDRRIVKLAADGSFVRDIPTYVFGVTVPYPYVTHIAVGPDGDVYAVSSHNVPFLFSSVLVFSKDGVFKRAITGVGTAPGQLGLIRGITVDSASNVYVADASKGLIQVFGADGSFVRTIGARGNGPGKFAGDMRGLAVDSANGWIYASDTQASQIEKFATTGEHLLTFGSEGTGPGQFGDGGRELTIGLDGNLYAPDFGNYRVLVFAPDGTFVRHFPDPVPDPPLGGFNQAMGVAVNDATGNVYVADTYNHRIQQFSATGSPVRQWGFRGSTDPYALNYPRGVTVEQATGRVWVANTRQGNVKTYTASGGFVSSFGSWGSGTGQYQLARDLVVTGNRIYHADSNNHRIVATDRKGTVLWTQPCGTTFIPGSGPGLLRGCTGVDVDSSGRVYAAAVTENALYVFNRNGTLLRKLTTLRTPYDVAVSGDRVYVSEFQGNRIVVLDRSLRRLGTFGSRGTGPGQFINPAALDIDGQGRVYVVDSLNERVQVFG
ncbi:MAG: 6-bladed beta-propeller [Actinobacteria bacterium]|nr:6-bladed beta-propeller [Actinomycetota bacterium]